MAKEVKVTNWGKSNIGIITQGRKAYQGLFEELHFKEDGSTSDEPSLALVITNIAHHPHMLVYTECSLATLKECMDELGYDIVKRQID